MGGSKRSLSTRHRLSGSRAAHPLRRSQAGIGRWFVSDAALRGIAPDEEAGTGLHLESRAGSCGQRRGGHGPGITIYLVDQEQWVPAHLACAGRYSLPNLIRTLRSATSIYAATTNRSTRGVDGEHHEPADRNGGAQQVEQLNGGHAWREGAAPRRAAARQRPARIQMGLHGVAPYALHHVGGRGLRRARARRARQCCGRA